MNIPGLIWPRPKELVEKHERGESLDSREMLALRSGSFYGPTELSELAIGQEEAPKRIYIMTKYNLLRVVDECEDASNKILSKDDKIWGIGRLSYYIGEVVRREPSKNGRPDREIEDMINSDDFKGLIQVLTRGASDNESRIFITEFGKGIVLRDLYRIRNEPLVGKKIAENIDYCVKNMGIAMTTHLERGPIETVDQYHTYCYYVAGTVGISLNKLIELKDKVDDKPVLLSDELAERFGKGLQMTNIIKNMRLDYNEGRRFIPGAIIHGEVSYEEMMDSRTAGKVRNNVLERILSYVEPNLNVAFDYIKSIPEKLSGYRAFCLVPLITAIKTLENIKDAGAEKVFRGDEDAIKIPYGINNIMDLSYHIVRLDEGKRTNSWLDAFRADPRSFSFRDGEYTKWSKDWLTIV